ncbi:MAG: type 4a pilus biogenesis protein PilO [Mariprofundales bacterium]
MNIGPFDLVKLEPLAPILPHPLWMKLSVGAAVFLLLFVGFFFVVWQPIQEEIDAQLLQVEAQRDKLKKNQLLAENIPLKRAEYKKLQKQLKVALNMLPKKSQIPDLLESVSWAGKDSGLEFSHFKPSSEMPRQFYAEVPVELKVTGSYVQILKFLQRVGEMPRIVSVRDVELSPASKVNELNVIGKAVTYRFLDAAPKK